MPCTQYCLKRTGQCETRYISESKKRRKRKPAGAEYPPPTIIFSRFAVWKRALAGIAQTGDHPCVLALTLVSCHSRGQKLVNQLLVEPEAPGDAEPDVSIGISRCIVQIQRECPIIRTIVPVAAADKAA